MASNWTPESWTAKEARHLPGYPDAAALDKVTDTLTPFLRWSLRVKRGH